MRVVPIKFECSTGIEERHSAIEESQFLIVSAVGLNHYDAIVRCLKEWNRRTNYDEKYLD